MIAYRESDDIGPESDLQPPSLDFKQTRALMQSRFPDFGLYAWLGPEESVQSEVMMGDAIDDLADIFKELSGVPWLAERGNEADAIWHFRLGFEKHWGATC